MFKAVADCPEDQYSNPRVNEGLEKWLSSDSHRNGYVMSDIKKSGLTFNRNIHNALIDVLAEAYPAWGWEDYYNYGNAKLHFASTDQWVPIRNGYGLGMLDCVISFTQACIYNMFIENNEHVAPYRLQAKFWSDDSVIRVRNIIDQELDIPQLDELMGEYNEFATKCGIVIHGKKPYVSRCGVFLETYGTSWQIRWDHAKRGQYLGCLFDVLKAPSIYRAKEIFATLCLEIPEEVRPWITTILDVIVPFWGYEFSEHETTVPFEAGGWVYSIEDGFNTFMLEAQEWDHPVLCNLTKMCMMPRPRKRVLALHKEHEDYISSLINMGIEDDPTAYSWRRLSESVLKQDYKQVQDICALEKKILKCRQSYWKKILQGTRDTELAYLVNYWDSCKGAGWYLPPRMCVEKVKIEDLYDIVLEEDKIKPPDISVVRAWLFACQKLGSKVSVCDPYCDYTDPESAASIMLTKLSHGKHAPLNKLAFCLNYGYDYEALRKKLRDKYGLGSWIKGLDQECDKVCNMLSRIITSTKGHYVYPLVGTPYSILTRLEGINPLARYPGDEMLGAALYMGHPSITYDPWNDSGDARYYIQGLASLARKNLMGTGIVQAPKEEDPNTANLGVEGYAEHLEYMTSMIRGLWASKNLEEHRFCQEEDNGPPPDFGEAVISAIDDDDFSMGDLFGDE